MVCLSYIYLVTEKHCMHMKQDPDLAGQPFPDQAGSGSGRSIISGSRRVQIWQVNHCRIRPDPEHSWRACTILIMRNLVYNKGVHKNSLS
jgi:hypothetical protein